MGAQLKQILELLEGVYSKPAWYGKPALTIFGETDESVVYERPNASSHSLLDLLYHMVTWQEFTLRRLKRIKETNMAEFEALDWRPIDPETHSWAKGVAAFQATHEEIKTFLEDASDDLLFERVDYRDYDFRFLLNGLIQHNIYHLGQIAYVQKLLK